MKKVIVGCHLMLLALGWFILSWFFFNPSTISARDPGEQDQSAYFSLEDDSGRQFRNRGRLFRIAMEELDLTEEQKEKIRSIFEEQWPGIEPLIRQLDQGREEFDWIGENGSFDEAQVRAVANQQAEIIIELMVMRQRTKFKVFAVLSQEQRAEAQRLLRVLRRSHPKGIMN